MGDEVPFIPFCLLRGPAPDSLIRWSIMILSACFVCIFGVYFIYLIWMKMKRKTPLMIIIQWGCTVIAVCFMTNSVLLCIHVATGIFCTYGYDVEEWIKIIIAALFFNQFGLSMMYLLYVFRLSYPFKGTVLATSKLLWIILFIGFILMLVFGTSLLLVLALAPMEKWEDWGLTARLLYQGTNLVFTIILLSIFLKKMLSLHDVSLLKQVIRQIICAAMGLLSSQLLDCVISSIRQTNDSEVLWMIHSILLMLDELVNLFCIYLAFPFGVKTFTKICGKLEKQCSKNVVKISGLKDVVELEPNTKSGDVDNASKNSTVTVTISDFSQNTTKKISV